MKVSSTENPESKKIINSGENLEREDDVEIEEGDRKGIGTEDSWSMSGEFIYRRLEEHRLKLYDPGNETFPIPLKYVDAMRQTQTSIKRCSYRPERRVLIFLMSGLGLQDSRSHAQDSLKDSCGKMEDR